MDAKLFIKLNSTFGYMKYYFYKIFYSKNYYPKSRINTDGKDYRFVLLGDGKLEHEIQVSARKGFDVRVNNGAYVYLGANTFFNLRCSITAQKKIIIGNNSIFGPNLVIVDHDHIYSKESGGTKKSGFISNDVIIGENVWCGANVTILRGVKIGNNSIVAAGTVVTKGDYPENSLIYNKRDVVIKSLTKEVLCEKSNML